MYTVDIKYYVKQTPRRLVDHSCYLKATSACSRNHRHEFDGKMGEDRNDGREEEDGTPYSNNKLFKSKELFSQYNHGALILGCIAFSSVEHFIPGSS